MGERASDIAPLDPIGDGELEADEQDVAATRAQIEQTRSELTETIDAIKEKLNPDRLVQQAKETVREATVGRAQEAMSQAMDTARETVGGAVDTAREAGSTVMDTIRQNPVPYAMVGIGLGWLWMESRRRPHNGDRGQEYPNVLPFDDRLRYDLPRHPARPAVGPSAVGETLHEAQQRVGEVAGHAQERAREIAVQVRERAGEVVEQVKERAGTVVSQVRSQVVETGSEATDWFGRMLRENPVAVGVVALGLGAALGLLVPETPQENRLMGESRDRLVDKTRQSAGDLAQKLQVVAGEAVDAASQAATEEAQNQGLTGQEVSSGAEPGMR
jgi:ElaB/YqjD/DUF883 family membrane-anchored ribosome-binding protein